jgi:hypothetical protein
MQLTDIRRDWTPSEKRFFEDIALEFLRLHSKPSQTRERFDGWLSRRYPALTVYADFIWSYVLAL